MACPTETCVQTASQSLLDDGTFAQAVVTKDSSLQCRRHGNLTISVIPHVKIVTGITTDEIMPEHNQISRKFT